MRDLSEGSWLALYLACCVLPALVGSDGVRKLFVWLIPAAGIALLVIQRNESSVMRLVAASLLFLYVMTGSILMTEPRKSIRSMGVWRIAAYMSIWPGMDPAGFSQPRVAPTESGNRFVHGLLFYLSRIGDGVIGLVLLSPSLSDPVLGWIGIASLLLVIHFGISEILSSLANLLGFRIGPLFDQPLKSKSLGEFWTVRWNRPFVEMDQVGCSCDLLPA